jgi:Fe-S cluster assembly protein SufD
MTSFSEQFATVRAKLPGSPQTAAQRRTAFEQFTTQGLPEKKHEEWRYTDLRPLRDAKFDLTTAPVTDERIADVRERLHGAGLPGSGPRAVFVDGQFVRSLSSTSKIDDFELISLAENWEHGATAFKTEDGIERHPLALLNSAFAAQGLAIRVPAKAAAGSVSVVFAGSGQPGTAAQPRMIVQLAEGSSLTLLYHFLDCGPADCWTNLVTQIDQARNSRLSIYQLQERAERQFQTTLIHATLARDAELKAGLFDIGGHLSRNDVDVKLSEPGARAEIFGAFFAADGQHVDNHIAVEHAAPTTTSRESFRGIVGAKGRGVFNGKVVVRPNAQGIDAKQNSDNLLLDESAEIDTKPELEIYADDVKCSHGATVGELDEQQLFYLRSRGIDSEAARALLTFAFANRSLAEIEIGELKDALATRIAARLPKHEQWERLT